MGGLSPAAILYDENNHSIVFVSDGVAYRIPITAKIAKGSDGSLIDPATEGGNLATLAGKDFATQTTLLAIKNTDGIKKIVDPITIASITSAPQIEGRYAADLIVSPFPVGIGGWDTSGYLRRLALDGQGRLVTSPPSGVSSLAGFACGYIAVSATTPVAVRATAYSEPTTNAGRSISSANAADAAAGTGARNVQITYFDQTGAGPYTETVTLNGTTAVNTVATNICFIEKLEVLAVGSGGVNAGIITLYASTGGGGGAVGSIAASDLRTFWGHHYVPTGKTAYITGLSLGHSGTTAGSGGVFRIRARTLAVATAPDSQISDFVRLYGQSSSFARTYGTAIPVTGPKRIALWVSPESSTAVTFRGAFDFYEV